jgi:Spy/CpxP family protein refolding chaperone
MKTKTIVFLSICTLLLAAGPGSAQQASDQTMLTYEVLSQEWNTLIGGVLDLSEEQAAAFWPLYEEYRAARGALMQERIDVIKMFVSGYDTMDAKYARGLLDNMFEIDGKILNVKREYAPRFDEILTPAQVVRLYQTENKLEVLMMAEVTKDVPLAK